MNSLEFLREYQLFVKALTPGEAEYSVMKERLVRDETVNLVHAQLGITTESGEFADALKKFLVYNRDLDRANLEEELGDLLWYITLACNTLGLTVEQVIASNKSKLWKRYEGKFSHDAANARRDKK